ncbi:alpha/beta hydrolase [Mesorhizobium muleiense]|uniref:alpha/beta hydrolase n=1 Tax=Mesorhizobium muleiense TaxID=1004279 RepID=UPI000B88BCC1|nr:alpha/beta-hydrolase family protein [Mesorhizobium muleiense]MCF6097984.1 alpha/beta-hydrolase family protein [Mesorhizobium muleiense]
MRTNGLRVLTKLAHSFPATGILVATLAFAVSLTPSLIPRSYLVQGVLSGLSAALGYGIGFVAYSLWTYLELPQLRDRTLKATRIAVAGTCVVIAAVFLWRTLEWQNSIRVLMDLAPLDTASPLKTGIVAVVVFATLMLLAHLFRHTFLVFSGWLGRFVPRRVSHLVGGLLAVALFWSVVEGLVFRLTLRILDSSFQEMDALIEDDLSRPAQSIKTGSAASLLSWEELGRQGRRFVSSGPTAAEIATFFGEGAVDPIRVYVGMSSADTADERAKLALQELKRTGAFERSILIIIVPTGTGMIDPAALDPVEYLHRGNVASVAMQYSYLASWLSLLVEPDYGAEAGDALFQEVYTYWSSLPRDARPKLYLHGLSLGAMNSEQSANLYDVVADPFQGALWSGPPFASRTWRSVTDGRNSGSPEWLPRFRNSSIFRFTNQNDALDIPDAEWGPIRIVYLQYASDPITFFDVATLYREPDWMKEPRGPDVSEEVRWYPLITMLQLTVDMAIATTSPMGYGHVFAPQHYIDAWLAVTDPPSITPEDIARLKVLFITRGATPVSG